MLTGLVLAGGKSSRMGQDKALLPYLGGTLLDHARQLLLQCGCDTVMVSRNQFGFIRDLVPEAGPLGGIHSALARLKYSDELLILPVDMPFMQPGMLNLLVRTGRKLTLPCHYEESHLPLYLPVSQKVVSYLNRLLGKKGQGSVHQMLGYLNSHSLPCPMPEQLCNLNTPTDWQQAMTG
ncbi:molybdenum cofactor guanylyltransferase [Bowmanella dokdonensis]|uniref:Molybdenum cofactor guanylyltransferase n=1 Tax=Bowmanella dokdonensis TaxID=751969 RepID=A0A939DM48_9ALTE|nr:molybdenum cofactor guanylyltransferase [Bowmanella dokdonensis]MBN7824361.1 molybdenum cofactor guanylyltransferase [Bowmanella dokdonensis]